MTVPASGIYIGNVVHTRMKPVRHHLKYGVFYLLLDVDNPDEGLRMLSRNRLNLFSFHDSDHGDGSARLRDWVEAEMKAAGLEIPRSIRLLTLPRVLGYVFNPVSLYFCYDHAGALTAVIYEVNNTFGERHSYLVRANGSRHLAHDCPKRFYVSPFNDMGGSYRMDLVPPQDDAPMVRFAINHDDDTGQVLFAGLTLKGRPLTDRGLLARFFGMPLMTFKVILAIHWEALKLWRKGLRLTRRPQPPAQDVTILPDPDMKSDKKALTS